MEQQNAITYLCNAGVLIKIKDKKILIDSLCGSDVPIYKSTPDDIREQIIQGKPPFDNIDLMLITHNHSDHFDAHSVAAFLQNSPNTPVIASKDVVANIRSHIPNTNTTNLIALTPGLHCAEKIKIKGIDITAISMLHDGKENADLSNLAFLIEYSMTVLHVGDAAPVKENYNTLNLQQYDIDLFVANFPYVSLPTSRQIITQYINPKKIAVVHLPYKELDRFGWINAAKKSYERVKDSFIPTEFLEEPGTSIDI